MEARGRDAEVDLIAGFASAIPVEIIGNLLGVPSQERAPLRDWSLAILGALEPTLTAEQLDARQPRRARVPGLSRRPGRAPARASPAIPRSTC